MENDRQVLEYAQGLMRDGVEVVIIIVLASDSVAVGSMYAISENGGGCGCPDKTDVPENLLQDVFNTGEPREHSAGHQRLLIMRVG